MKLVRILATTAALMGLVAFSTQAGGAACQAAAAKQTASTCAASSAACAAHATTASASCPHSGCALMAGGNCCQTTMAYQVMVQGEAKKTSNRIEAETWAKAAGAPIEFVVAGKTYSTEPEAKEAIFSTLFTTMQSMLVVSCVNEKGETVACSATQAKMAKEKTAMTYRVANHDFATREAADSFLAKVNARMQTVKMVDDQGKPVEGCAVEYAKAAHCKSFTIGDKKIDDPLDANITFAQERLRLIVTTEA